MPINSFIYPAPSTPSAYSVANSCRFNDDDSAYMHKTPGGAGDRRTFTFSCWFKRANIGLDHSYFIDCDNGASQSENPVAFRDDYLQFSAWNGSSNDFTLKTSQVFRDVSAWYHIVVAVDTTQGTAANRVKMYVNGTQVTSWTTETYPDQNYDMGLNTANQHSIGRWQDGDARYFDGYMAEVVFIDGTQYAASDFGEFDEDSPTIWKPIDVSGLTFGTNGFYLDFEASDNLGNDANGGTDLTEVNLAAADQCQDSPTNNFCTLNPLDVNVAADLTSTEGNTIFEGARYKATFGVSSGKWYWEVKRVNAPDNAYLGIKGDDGDWTNAYANSYTTYTYNGNYYLNGSSQGSYGDSSTTNDILMFALDMDNGKFYIGENGTWHNSGDPAAGSNEMASSISGTYLPAVINNTTDGTDQYSFNFGNPSFTISSGNADADGYGNFEYAPPSGTNTFYALCTKNLAEYG